jgi:hypothetical protein
MQIRRGYFLPRKQAGAGFVVVIFGFSFKNFAARFSTLSTKSSKQGLGAERPKKNALPAAPSKAALRGERHPWGLRPQTPVQKT